METTMIKTPRETKDINAISATVLKYIMHIFPKRPTKGLITQIHLSPLDFQLKFSLYLRVLQVLFGYVCGALGLHHDS
jgi:hypothetical protein